MLEELSDALEPFEDNSSEDPVDCEDPVETVMAVGAVPVEAHLKERTTRLQKFTTLAAQIPYKALEGVSAQYMTADGSPMTCSKTMTGLQWWTQSHTFISDVGILPLQCCDMIAGEDWLESCSPMWVHLQKKIMKITYAGNRITLKDLN